MRLEFIGEERGVCGGKRGVEPFESAGSQGRSAEMLSSHMHREPSLSQALCWVLGAPSSLFPQGVPLIGEGRQCQFHVTRDVGGLAGHLTRSSDTFS